MLWLLVAGGSLVAGDCLADCLVDCLVAGGSLVSREFLVAGDCVVAGDCLPLGTPLVRVSLSECTYLERIAYASSAYLCSEGLRGSSGNEVQLHNFVGVHHRGIISPPSSLRSWLLGHDSSYANLAMCHAK